MLKLEVIDEIDPLGNEEGCDLNFQNSNLEVGGKIFSGSRALFSPQERQDKGLACIVSLGYKLKPNKSLEGLQIEVFQIESICLKTQMGQGNINIIQGPQGD